MKDISTEQLILEAAEKEFLEKGFSGAKTTSIAQNAGVTHAMLHYYFRTKENLFNNFCKSKINLIMDNIMLPYVNSDASLFEQISQMVDSHFAFMMENPLLPKFVINELFSRREVLNEIIGYYNVKTRDFMEKLNDNIKAEVKAEIIHDVDPLVLLTDIIALNICTFIMLPFVQNLSSSLFGSDVDRLSIIEQRKKENIELIIKRLKK